MNRILLLVAGLWASAAQAQLQPDAPTIQYFKSEPYRQLMGMMGLVYERNIFQRTEVCPSGYRWDPISFAILQSLVMPATGDHPEAGTWTMRFKFQGCGNSTTYNVMYRARAGNSPQPVVLPPGNTRADPTLAYDLLRGVGAAGARAGASPECKSVHVLSTEVTVPPFQQEDGGKVVSGVWEESWRARACDKEFTADFCLTPQPGGGTNWALSQCRR